MAALAPLDAMRQADRYLALPLVAALAVRLGLEPGLASRAPLWLAANLGFITLLLCASRVLAPFDLDRPRAHATLLFVVGINGGYQVTGHFMRSAGGWRADNLLWAGDRWLLGGRDAQAWLAGLNLGWVNDLLSISYIFFLVLLPVVSAYYIVFARPGRLSRYWRGLMVVYGAGLAGYLLLPAAGPYLYHPQALPALRHGLVSGPLHAFIASLSTGVDVWPSLHCAVTFYILLWLWQVVPAFGRALLIPSALVVVSTLALQYHYLIDVLCGIAVAVVAIRVARPLENANDFAFAAQL